MLNCLDVSSICRKQLQLQNIRKSVDPDHSALCPFQNILRKIHDILLINQHLFLFYAHGLQSLFVNIAFRLHIHRSTVTVRIVPGQYLTFQVKRIRQLCRTVFNFYLTTSNNKHIKHPALYFILLFLHLKKFLIVHLKEKLRLFHFSLWLYI